MKFRKTIAVGIALLLCLLTFVGFYDLYLYDVGITNNYLAEKQSGVVSTTQVIIVRIPPGSGENLHLGFKPAIVTIIIGVNSTVTWINEDSTWHTVHSNIGQFYSNLIQPRENFTYAFKQPGVYSYHDDPHPWMTGKITVLSPQTNYALTLSLSIGHSISRAQGEFQSLIGRREYFLNYVFTGSDQLRSQNLRWRPNHLIYLPVGVGSRSCV